MESFSRTDGTTTNLNWRSDLLGFLHGRMPQRIPALELDKSFCFFSCFFFFLPEAVTYQGLPQQKNRITSHG